MPDESPESAGPEIRKEILQTLDLPEGTPAVEVLAFVEKRLNDARADQKKYPPKNAAQIVFKRTIDKYQPLFEELRDTVLGWKVEVCCEKAENALKQGRKADARNFLRRARIEGEHLPQSSDSWQWVKKVEELLNSSSPIAQPSPEPPPTPEPPPPPAPVAVAPPPAPAPVETTAPVRVDPPIPVRVEPPAPIRVEPPAPVRVEPPTPVRVEPPPTPVWTPPAPAPYKPPVEPVRNEAPPVPVNSAPPPLEKAKPPVPPSYAEPETATASPKFVLPPRSRPRQDDPRPKPVELTPPPPIRRTDGSASPVKQSLPADPPRKTDPKPVRELVSSPPAKDEPKPSGGRISDSPPPRNRSLKFILALLLITGIVLGAWLHSRSPARQTTKFVIHSIPAPETITINDGSAAAVPASGEVEVNGGGNYGLAIFTTDYIRKSTNISIKTGQTLEVNFGNLEKIPKPPTRAVFVITSSPRPDTYTINSSAPFALPDSGELVVSNSGSYLLAVQAANYVSKSTNVSISLGETNTVDFGELQKYVPPPTTATFVILSDPRADTIKVDNGEPMPLPSSGEIPVKSEGTYTLTVFLKGHDSKTTNASIMLGQTLTVNFGQLQPLKSHLKITSTPSDAEIIVDGVPMPDRTPVLNLDVSPGRREVVVRKNGREDKKIFDLKPGDFDEFAAKITQPPPPTVEVSVDSEPRGAGIRYKNLDNNESRPLGNTPVTGSLPPGRYTFTWIPDQDRESESTNVTLKLGTHVFLSKKLRTRSFNVVVKSDPPGASIYMDDRLQVDDRQQTLRTPATLAVREGNHRFKLALPVEDNYLPAEEDKEVRPDTGELRFALRPGNVKVLFNTTPTAAQVIIGNKLLGQTPLTVPFEPGPNPYSVILRLTNFEDESIPLLVKPGPSPAPIERTLRPISTTVSVAVGSRPSGAEIWLDGKDTGKTTPNNIIAAAGYHQVELRRDDCDTNWAGFSVQTGAPVPVIDLVLTRKPIAVQPPPQDTETALMNLLRQETFKIESGPRLSISDANNLVRVWEKWSKDNQLSIRSFQVQKAFKALIAAINIKKLGPSAH